VTEPDFNPDRFRAQMDQAQSAFKDLAPAIASFWLELQVNGMDRASSTAIVCTWVAGLFQQGKQS